MVRRAACALLLLAGIGAGCGRAVPTALSALSDGGSSADGGRDAASDATSSPTDLQSEPICGVVHAGDEALFAYLTANEWENGCPQTGPLPSTCTRLRLSADGSYTWSAWSDYAERDQSGTWNFTARDANAGIVCLDNGAVLDFARVGSTLSFAAMSYVAGAQSITRGSRSELPALSPSALYQRLVSTEWWKSNRFDLFREPERFTLVRDGTFTASYRGGSCRHGGTWSLDQQRWGSGVAEVFSPHSEPNRCDERSGGSEAYLAAANEQPRLSGELLIFFAASYRPAASNDSRPLFVFDSYSSSVATTGVFTRELRIGERTPLALSFENRSEHAMSLGRLRITLSTLTSSGNGFGAGDPVELLAKDLGQQQVAPGAHHDIEVALTPPFGGTTVQLGIELSYEDEHQSYSGRASYVLSL